MSLAAKLNTLLLLTFCVCFVAVGFIANRILEGAARDEVIQRGRLLMDSSSAAATYTAKQIYPLLEDQLKTQFLPQSIPDYAATENLIALRDTNPDYSFKEAMLNPTNPRDRATDWEEEIIVHLRDHPGAGDEMVGQRDTPMGPALFIARPIVIKSQTCLQCHSKASDAPPNIIEVYGSSNGFNWNLNEVIGAKIVSVPMSLPQARAHQILKGFMLSLLVVFALVLIGVNVLLNLVITRRVARLSRIADHVSMGNLDAETIDTRGRDELSTLAQSVDRLRSSLSKAMKLLGQ